MLCLAGVTAADAQTLRINNAAQATGKTAADFATTAIGDPWDFENPEDYSYWYSIDGRGGVSTFTSVPTISDGLLRGTLRGGQGSAAFVQMQFEGIAGAYNQVSRTGIAHPIDANRFKRLSFRMRRSALSTNERMGAGWFKNIVREASSMGSIHGLSRNREVSPNPVVNQSPSSISADTSRYHIYAIDLDGSADHGSAPYAGTVYGLQLRIATEMNGSFANSGVELDWVRLTERDSAVVTLSWSGFGTGPVTIIARCDETGDEVQLSPDGLGPNTFASNGSYQWDYGFLPGGTWTLTARGSGGATATAKLTINPAPYINVLDPDAAGGRDWATTVLGDAWDLTNQEDVTRSGQLHQIVTGVFGERGLEGATRGGSWSDLPDPLVMLTQNWGKRPGTYPVIDGDTYHRLSFEIQSDHPELIAPEALTETWGSVARVMWEQDGRVPPRTSQDLLVMDGTPNRFVMDLAKMNTVNEVEEPNGTSPWAGGIGALWFRVNESFTPRNFRLANVRLAADDAPNGNGFFTIRWSATDATFSRQIANSGASDARVKLYYAPESNPSDRRLLTSGDGVLATDGRFSWDVAGLAPGLYVVFAEITDSSGNTQGRMSTGPVRVSALPANLRTDSNSNGLPDWWEGRYAASNPTADTDGDGVPNIDEYRGGTNPLTSNVWNLSEGATGFFSERLALANPDDAPAEVTVTYLRENGGGPIVRQYSLLPHGRLTVNVNEVAGLRQDAISAVVTTNTGGVVVERSMFWGDQWYGGHTGKAMQNPQREWFLAEGAANARFSTYILLANATGSVANVRLQFLLEGAAPDAAPIYLDVPVQPFKRYTVSIADEPRLTSGGQLLRDAVVGAFSTRITSDVPITVERSMYFHGPQVMEGGTEAAAVPRAERNWYLAEGATGFFSEYVLIANPGATTARVNARFLGANGELPGATIDVGPFSRYTIDMAAAVGAGQTVSVALDSSQPIVVERAMYWPSSGWLEAHASAGVTQTGTLLALAEGETGGARAFESYVLVANPSTEDATVRVTLLREAGRPPASMAPVTVGAGKRWTISFGEFVAAGLIQAGEKCGVLISSENNVPIVAERAMYWNGGGLFWGGGSGETAFTLK